jgi:O-antigen/teichoic acid export membrane protein
MEALRTLKDKWDAMDGIFSLQFFNALRQASLLLGSVLIARSGLNLAEIGTFETLQFLNFLFTFVWYTGLFSAYLRKAGEETSFLTLHSVLPFFIVFFFSLLVGILIFMTGPFWRSFFDLDLSSSIFFYFLVYMVTQIPVFFLPVLLMVWEQKNLSVAFSLLYFLAYAVFFLVYYLVGEGIELLLMGMAGVNTLFFLLSLLLVGIIKNTNWLLQTGFLTKWLFSSLPLMLYSFLGSLAFFFDNWWINHWFQDKEVYALFRYGARELPFVQTFVITLGSGMVFQLAKDPKMALGMLRKKTSAVLRWLGPLCLLLTLMSPFLFQWLYGSPFKESAFVFNMYLLLLFSRLFYSQSLVLAWGDHRILVLFTFFELIINVGLSILWIQSWGVMGVVMATVIAFFFEKIALAVYVAQKHKVNPKAYLPIWHYLGTFALVIVFNLLSHWFLQ